MSPDPSYVLSPQMQNIFFDKATGLPMSGGYVKFYDDVNRSVLKPIYELSGTSPAYFFTELANPVQLSAIGTYVDENNADINVFLTPFDDEGNLSLYYVEVYNNGDVLQFTREAWPPFELASGETPGAETNQLNYIPNGQFLAHNLVAQNVDDPITVAQVLHPGNNIIAPGGWEIDTQLASMGAYFYGWSPIGFSDNPTSSPPYALLFTIITADPADRIYIGPKFNDVNKFSTTNTTNNEYTFSISTKSTGATVPVNVVVVKYFGSGSSALYQTEIVGSFNILPGDYIASEFSFDFGSNSGFAVGPNNDDFVQIALQIPNVASSVLITDAVLVQGNVNITEFPVQTNADTLARSVAGWMPVPAYDGSDLFLPLKVAPGGLIFDDSEIGSLVFSSTLTTPDNSNLLPCDGSAYIYSSYSDLGVPYSRLGDKLFYDEGTVYAGPIYGTGLNYMTAYRQDSNSSQFRISTNKAGSQTAASDGGTATGFTFAPISTGQTNTQVSAYISDVDGFKLNVIGDIAGLVSSATAGTSGFTITELINKPTLKQHFTISDFVVPTHNQYFTFNRWFLGSNDAYYVWFNVNGAGGSGPVVAGTAIQVRILSTWTAEEVAYAIRESIQGFQNVAINPVVATSIPEKSFFNVYSNSVKTIVWYTKTDTLVPPTEVADKYIRVRITDGQNKEVVTTATITAMNQYFVVTPDLRGQTLRFPAGATNIDSGYRGSLVVGDVGLADTVGSFENYQVQSHNHNTTSTITAQRAGFGAETDVSYALNSGVPMDFDDLNITVSNYGGTETNGLNFGIVPYIRY